MIIIAGASARSPQEVQELLELVWAGAIQPLLFGLAGASVRFDTLPLHLGLKALAVAAIGKTEAKSVLLLLGSAIDVQLDFWAAQYNTWLLVNQS